MILLLGDPIIVVIIVVIVIMIMVFVSINMVFLCITIVIRSVVVEEGVVTADGLAVDWVSLLRSFILDKSVQIYNVCHCLQLLLIMINISPYYRHLCGIHFN